SRDRAGLEPGAAELDLDGAELAVAALLGRLVGQQVLRAQLGLDAAIDPGQLDRPVDEVGAAAGLGGDLLELQAAVGLVRNRSQADGVEGDAAVLRVLERVPVAEAAP